MAPRPATAATGPAQGNAGRPGVSGVESPTGARNGVLLCVCCCAVVLVAPPPPPRAPQIGEFSCPCSCPHALPTLPSVVALLAAFFRALWSIFRCRVAAIRACRGFAPRGGWSCRVPHEIRAFCSARGLPEVGMSSQRPQLRIRNTAAVRVPLEGARLSPRQAGEEPWGCDGRWRFRLWA